jgi:hypothetical protein
MLRLIRNSAGRVGLFAARVVRAWRYWRRLRYTWHLAWAKAGYGHTLDEHADIRHAGTR